MQITQVLISVMLAVFFAVCQLQEVVSQLLPPMVIIKNAASDNIETTQTVLSMDPLDRLNELDSLKFKTAQNTRYLEMVGYALSLNAILGSIYIFSAFKALHNKRTVIHKNLLCAILLETIVRIILYSDQALFRDIEQIEAKSQKGIENMPYICESVYVLLEYTRLCVYCWMLIEGIFLNTLVSANTLRNEIPSIYYYIGGWVVPAILTAIWVAVTADHYSGDKLKMCWYGYNYLPSYYIVQGPILGIIGINIVFLGSIMHVIVNKLRRTNNSELLKVKKTVRAALILLPLLGIGNIFNMFDYPLDGSATGFAIWCYATHFFRSFQGVFITLIYCYTNGEVLKVLKKKWERYNCWTGTERRRRGSCGHSTRDRAVFHISNNELNEEIPMRTMQWNRPSSVTNNLNISEGEPLAELSIQIPPRHLAFIETPLTEIFPRIQQYNPPRAMARHTIPRTVHRTGRPGLVTHETLRRERMRFCI